MGLEGVVNTFFKGKDLESGDADRILQYRAECIKAALAPSFTGIGINYGENFERVINRYKFKKTVREQLRKRRVIELGPGDDPKAKLLFERYDIGEYVGVEPFYYRITEERLNMQDERISVVREDGLSYLLNQPDENAIVVSSGVVCPELFKQPCGSDYLRFLGREIFRVTPEGGVTVHLAPQPGDFFVEHGFKALHNRDDEFTYGHVLVKPHTHNSEPSPKQDELPLNITRFNCKARKES